MAYWLTPIDSLTPFVLGAGRIRCESSAELDEWREALRQLHPRLLPLFKASMLPGDPHPSAEAADPAACGLDRIPFSLAGADPIRFDGPFFGLSSCGEAMTERLLEPEEALGHLETFGTGAVGLGLSVISEQRLTAMRRWLGQGKRIILIREDT